MSATTDPLRVLVRSLSSVLIELPGVTPLLAKVTQMTEPSAIDIRRAIETLRRAGYEFIASRGNVMSSDQGAAEHHEPSHLPFRRQEESGAPPPVVAQIWVNVTARTLDGTQTTMIRIEMETLQGDSQLLDLTTEDAEHLMAHLDLALKAANGMLNVPSGQFGPLDLDELLRPPGKPDMRGE